MANIYRRIKFRLRTTTPIGKQRLRNAIIIPETPTTVPTTTGVALLTNIFCTAKTSPRARANTRVRVERTVITRKEKEKGKNL